jgi:hypothetical protein
LNCSQILKLHKEKGEVSYDTASAVSSPTYESLADSPTGKHNIVLLGALRRHYGPRRVIRAFETFEAGLAVL